MSLDNINNQQWLVNPVAGCKPKRELSFLLDTNQYRELLRSEPTPNADPGSPTQTTPGRNDTNSDDSESETDEEDDENDYGDADAYQT